MTEKATQKKPGDGDPGLNKNVADIGLQLKKLSYNPPKKSRLNRRAAIRERCLDCSGSSAREVRECPITECPLYSFRLPKYKQNSKVRDKAIRAYCREWCMAGQRREVELCPSTDCPLFKYRHTKTKKVNIEPLPEEKNPAEGDRPGGAYA